MRIIVNRPLGCILGPCICGNPQLSKDLATWTPNGRAPIVRTHRRDPECIETAKMPASGPGGLVAA